MSSNKDCHSSSKVSTSMTLRILSIFLALALAQAFQASLPRRVQSAQQVARPSSALFILLSEEETNAILMSATECAEGECSVEDVTSLIKELEEQKRILQKRLDKTMNLVSSLQHVNQKEEREVDEVRSFVKDLLFVFSHDQKKHFASGFSGDIPKGGSKTAWDALDWGKKSP